MKKRLLTAGISVVLILSAVCAFAACSDTRTDGIFSEGVIAVANEDGLWGYADSNGDVAINYQYAQATPFRNGVAAVAYSSGGKFFIIDKEGAHISGPYDSAAFSKDGKWIVVQNDSGFYGVYDTANKTMKLDCVYDSVSELENGFFLTVYETYYTVTDLSAGTTVAGPFDGNSSADVTYKGTQGKWLFTRTVSAAAEEGGADVVTYKAVDMATGEEYGQTWSEMITYDGWTVMRSVSADGSAVRQWVVTDSAVIEVSNDAVIGRMNDSDTLLVSVSVTDSSDSSHSTVYTLYGENGAQLYTGNTAPVWSGDSYLVCNYDESAGLSFTAAKEGVAYSANVPLPEGHTWADAANFSFYESGAASFEVSYRVRGQDGTEETHNKYMFLSGGNLSEVPEGYTVESAYGGRVVLRNTAADRVGVFDMNMNAVTECIYSGVEVTESGYMIVRLGKAYGVLAEDGTVVMDCVYTAIAA